MELKSLHFFHRSREDIQHHHLTPPPTHADDDDCSCVIHYDLISDMLLDNGAELTLCDKNQNTALHYACINVRDTYSLHI